MEDSNKTEGLQAESYLGPYKILRLLGEGSMGQVYLGYEESLDRKVAIKIISPSKSKDSSIVARFNEEGKALATLKHPNLVTAYSLSKDKGIHYLAMEYAEGEPLDLILSERTFSVEEAYPIFIQLLEGMSAFHKKTILHRDIKPKNIIIETGGNPKIVDFGIVKNLASSQGDFTSYGIVIGTLNYLAPELAAGKQASMKTDIWSMGVTFYEMLTGQNPYVAENSLATLENIRSKPMEFPKETDHWIPKPLQDIVKKMCHQTPSERYFNTEDILRDLKTNVEPVLNLNYAQTTKNQYRLKNLDNVKQKLLEKNYSKTKIKRILSLAARFQDQLNNSSEDTLVLDGSGKVEISEEALSHAEKLYKAEETSLMPSENTAAYLLSNFYALKRPQKVVAIIMLLILATSIPLTIYLKNRNFTNRADHSSEVHSTTQSDISISGGDSRNTLSDCNPFASDTSSCDRGLKGDLFYLSPDQIKKKESIQSNPTYAQNKIDHYISNGVRKEGSIIFPNIFIPQRHYVEGLFMEGATELKKNDGTPLIEHFAIRLNSILQLTEKDQEGDYQFGILSDDGSILEIKNEKGKFQTLIDNDGPHATRFECAKDRVSLDHDSRLPIKVSYYQGPPTEVSLVLMWRPWKDDRTHCGVEDVELYFGPGLDDFSNYGFAELKSKGWRVIPTENFILF